MKIQGINAYRNRLEKVITFQSGLTYLMYSYYTEKRYVIGVYIALLSQIIGAPVVCPIYIGSKKPWIRNLYLIKPLSWILQLISIPVTIILGLLYLLFSFIWQCLFCESFINDSITKFSGYITLILMLIGIYTIITWF